MRWAGIATLLLLLPLSAQAGYKNYNLSMLYGQDVAVKSYHDVTLRARCQRVAAQQVQDESGAPVDIAGRDILFLYAVVTRPAILRGHDNYLGNGSYLNRTTPPSLSRLMTIESPTGVERFDNGVNGAWVLDLIDRTGMSLAADKAVLAVNPHEHDGCYVSVMFDKITPSKEAKGGFVLR